MANKTTVALTLDQYIEIIETMKTGGSGFRPNEKIATALMLEANLGMRISDILAMTPKSIIRDGNRFRLDVVEKKTKKKRNFSVPKEVMDLVNEYCNKHCIGPDDLLFPYTERNVQKYLVKVADYLGYDNIGSHSFRKFFATSILERSNYNLILTQRLLNHSSPVVTQAYIGISSREMEQILADHVFIVK